MRHTTLSTVKPEPGESREAVLAHPHIVDARRLGWECDHDPDSRGGVVNRPDWEFLWPLDAGPCPTPHRHCYVELKAGNRQLTDGQRRRLANLRAAGEVAEEVRIDNPFGVAQLRSLLGLRGQEAARQLSGTQQCAPASAGPQAPAERPDAPPPHQCRLRKDGATLACSICGKRVSAETLEQA